MSNAACRFIRSVTFAQRNKHIKQVGLLNIHVSQTLLFLNETAVPPPPPLTATAKGGGEGGER